VLEFQQRILGVTPEEPGFARVRVQPNRCGLTRAEGSVCTPHGLIRVAWHIAGGKFHLALNLPADLPTTVVAPDGRTREFTGRSYSESYDLP
jgi:hypothetical protein